MNLTLRGRFAALLLALAVAFGLGIASGPYCWLPAGGYGTCH